MPPSGARRSSEAVASSCHPSEARDLQFADEKKLQIPRFARDDKFWISIWSLNNGTTDLHRLLKSSVRPTGTGVAARPPHSCETSGDSHLDRKSTRLNSSH